MLDIKFVRENLDAVQDMLNRRHNKLSLDEDTLKKAGASAISCLTEPKYFKGKNQYLEEISKEVSIPILENLVNI